jgi:hypothetical protein
VIDLDTLNEVHVPDAVIKTTRNPLSDKIACLLGLHKVLITVHIRDVPKRLSLNLITRSITAKVRSNVRWLTHSSIYGETCVD